MNLWRLTTMNLHELLRRLRAGESRSAIVRTLHVSPHTVVKYQRWAEAQQLLSGSLPDLSELEVLRSQTLGAQRPQRHPNESSLAAYRTEIGDLLERGRTPMTIWRLLKQQHTPHFTASPSAV